MTLAFFAELILEVLLAATLCYCIVLERRLAAVRKGQEGLKTHIGELNMAIAGAGASLRALKAAAGRLDHGMLNDHPGLELPSLEHLCRWFANQLKPEWPGLCRVTVSRPTIHERCTLSL